MQTSSSRIWTLVAVATSNNEVRLQNFIQLSINKTLTDTSTPRNNRPESNDIEDVILYSTELR